MPRQKGDREIKLGPGGKQLWPNLGSFSVSQRYVLDKIYVVIEVPPEQMLMKRKGTLQELNGI